MPTLPTVVAIVDRDLGSRSGRIPDSRPDFIADGNENAATSHLYRWVLWSTGTYHLKFAPGRLRGIKPRVPRGHRRRSYIEEKQMKITVPIYHRKGTALKPFSFGRQGEHFLWLGPRFHLFS